MGVSMRVQVQGPLAEFRSGFDAELESVGYTDLSRAQLVRLLARLSDWLADHQISLVEVDDAVLGEFLAARRAAGCAQWTSVIGLGSHPVVVYLRAVGAIPVPAPSVDATPTGRLLDAYRLYLVQERGLAAITVFHYVDVARRFAGFCSSAHGEAHGRAREVVVEEVAAKDVTSFVLAECARGPVGTGLLTGLRSLLRYLYFEGLIGTELAWAVPSAAGWSGASLPKDVPPVQLDALLGSCDRRRGVGRRDYALMILMARLGLRAAEAGGLRIDDIDWRAGDLVVRGKGRRDERLPLPADVGEAIVAYLQRGRPTCSSRLVFVACRAPFGGLAPPSVTDIVYRACDRAGLPRVGAHRLRHTAATQMLRRGATLAEVAQVLRHHDPLTTSTYAKVDRGALATLAQPWPGTLR